MSKLQKPGYALTRRAFWISFGLAWLVIVLIVCGAIVGAHELGDLAAVVIPSMVALIAAMLGIHRFAGSLDMRSIVDEAQGDARGEREGPPE